MTQKKPGRLLVSNAPDNDADEIAAIAAVQAYERVQRRIVVFMSEHPEVFDAYRKLIESLESKRKIADAKMRATDASFGDWKRTEARTYDAALLCEKVGLPAFLELGGVVATETVHSIDKDTIELAIEEKKIPAAVVELVRTIQSKYHAPKALKGPDP